MRSALLLAALLLPAAARAGIVYDFLTTIDAERTHTRVTGRVWVDGNSYRAELAPDPARKIDVVISNDADRTAVLLDVDKETWVDRVRINNDIRSSSLFLWPLRGATVKGKPEVTHHLAGKETIAGQRATLHMITASFTVESRLDGVPVRGRIETTARVWTADELPSLPMDRQLRTGYDEVDRRLEPIFRDLEGMIVRHELEVIRKLDGGPPQRELTWTSVSAIEIVDVPREKFEVPREYAWAGALK